MIVRRSHALILVLLAVSACAGARSNWAPLAEEPPRPGLPEGFDPNDPYDLYRYGESQLDRAPEQAARAFYWASRLDPLWADPVYARRTALFMAEPGIFYDYLFNRRRVAHLPGVAQLDSLFRRALMLNPFLQRRHDVKAIKNTIIWRIQEDDRRSGAQDVVDKNEIAYALNYQLGGAPDDLRGWLAESEGRFADALEHYRRAVSRDPEDAGLRADLARVQFRLGFHHEALESFAAAIELLHERDEEELVRLYQSKVLLEHSVGLILENQGDLLGAREAYARALQEDISYAPAHVRLGDLALADGDTATALSEFALAVEVAPEDAGFRYLHGRMLARAGDLDRAESELRRAIELEPFFAMPYRLLGEVLERQGRTAEAVEQYRAFLERASRRSPDREVVERRLTTVANGGAGGSGVRP